MLYMIHLDFLRVIKIFISICILQKLILDIILSIFIFFKFKIKNLKTKILGLNSSFEELYGCFLQL